MRSSCVFILVISCLYPLSALSLHPIDGVFRGRVNMQGAIIDDACAISVESSKQTIDMDTIPLAEIFRDGMSSRSTSFSIFLIRCSAELLGKEPVKNFAIIFDGERDGDLFSVHGEASGVALQIMDAKGNIAVPGEAMPLKEMIVDNGKLSYTLTLKSNHQVLKPGDYFASIRFKLDYF